VQRERIPIVRRKYAEKAREAKDDLTQKEQQEGDN